TRNCKGAKNMISLTSQQLQLLERIEEYLFWAGRYPLPFQISYAGKELRLAVRVCLSTTFEGYLKSVMIKNLRADTGADVSSVGFSEDRSFARLRRHRICLQNR